MSELRLRYPGVKPFEEGDANVFFGRKQETASILRQIESNRVIVVHGKSGIGKSSLIKAGLLPALEALHRDDARPIRALDFKFGYCNPNSTDNLTPLKKFINFLRGSKTDSSTAWTSDVVVSKDTLWLEIKRMLRKDEAVPVIFLDQFEEIFSYRTEDIEAFILQLAALYYGALPRDVANLIERTKILHPGKLSPDDEAYLRMSIDIRIVITIRSDRFDQLDRIRRAFPDLLRNTYLLDALDEDNARMAMIEPAAQPGSFASLPFTFHEKAITDILKFLTDKDPSGRIEAFQLQLFCQFIERAVLDAQNKNRIEEILTAHLPDDLGSVNRDFYQNTINLFAPDQQEKVRIFVEESLVLADGNEKRRISLDSFLAEKILAPSLLKKLVDASLIREVRVGTGSTNYELSHDALIDPILLARQERKNNDKLSQRANKLQEVDNLINQAYENLKTNDFIPATECFEKALDLLKDTSDTHHEQTELLLKLGTHFIVWWQWKVDKNRLKDWTMLELSREYLHKALEYAATNQELLGNIHEKLGVLHQLRIVFDTVNEKRLAIEHYSLAQQAYEKKNKFSLSGKVHETLAPLVDEKELQKDHLKAARSAYQLAGDFIDSLRVEHEIEMMDSNRPWGYLLDLKSNEVLPLRKNVQEIGRSTEGVENSISFRSQFVSRRHLKIQNNFTIEDLRSRNGTSLNGLVIVWGKTYILADEDIITMAFSVPLRFSVSYPSAVVEKLIPDNAWAVCTIGKEYSYLTEDFYVIGANDQPPTETQNTPNLNVTAGEDGEGQLRIRKDENDRFEMMVAEGAWSLVFTRKDDDYKYSDYILEFNSWGTGVSDPLTFVKLSDDGAIGQYGPTLQIIPFKDAEPAKDP